MLNVESFSSGRFEKGTGGYKYFVPAFINDEWHWASQGISVLLQNAAVKLGELNSFAQLVPNVNLFIRLHITKEAVVSSRIEGTQTNINEALLPEDVIKPERREDWREVSNYVSAINQAISELQTLPISSRLLKKTHAILLNSVRGAHKQPGYFRKSQNWIGGSGPTNASFVPPHHDHIPGLMSDLEKFLHNEEIDVPAIIRIAIAHYQFETIHPFLDGNGRIGRLLITLYLVSTGILDQPLLYLSTYFEKDKSQYFEKLDRVRHESDLMQWLRYFLTGLKDTAEEAVQVLKDVLALKNELETYITNHYGRKSDSALRLLNQLFKDPVTQVSDVAANCQISKKAANDLVQNFIQSGILKEVTGRSKGRVYVFDRYINLYAGNT